MQRSNGICCTMHQIFWRGILCFCHRISAILLRAKNVVLTALTSVLQMVIQDWFPLGLKLLAVQGTLRSLLQHHNSKVSTLWRSAFFIAQLSHTYVTTRKTVVLTRRTFVGKVMYLLFNMLSRLVIAFLTRGKHLFFFFFFNFMVQSPWCNLQWFWSPQK